MGQNQYNIEEEMARLSSAEEITVEERNTIAARIADHVSRLNEQRKRMLAAATMSELTATDIYQQMLELGTNSTTEKSTATESTTTGSTPSP